jgi:hypothetical protein
MIRSGSSIVRNAFAALSLRLLLAQLGFAAIVFLLIVVWLRLPDASALSVVATVLLGVLLLALISGGEVALMLSLYGRPLTPSRILKGAVAFLACIALWLLWSWVIAALESRETLLAGYLNSRFPASLRNVFSYQHLYLAMEWAASLLLWLAAGVFAALAYSIAASTRPRHAMRSIIASATYWVALIFGCFAASALTVRLMNWTPGHSLGIEMSSLVARLILVTVVDAAIALFVLAVIAACIRRSEASYETAEGGPDGSQPLTMATP